MNIAEWHQEARGDMAGVEFTAAGPAVRIDGEMYTLREPKIRELRQLDVLFWKLNDEEQAIIEAAGDDQIKRRREVNGWLAGGGYASAWILAINMLAGATPADATTLDVDDMPAWATTGDVLLQLISVWWNTPLARGPQAPLPL